MIRFLLENGIQTFAVSWRNPTAAHRDWGLDTYVAALDEAVDAAREISDSEDISMMGSCSGGITSSAYFATLGSAAEKKIKNLVLAVCLLDPNSADESTLGCLMTPETMRLAKETSRLRGIVDGHDLARMFAWMRPNDLVWNYWVNNYLLGQDPPAFDVLAWNADMPNMTAGLHADFASLFLENPLPQPGKLTVLGTPIDLAKVDQDAYIVAALTDHITPWEACHRTVGILGGTSRFVLSSSGHIQAIVNPPGNKKLRMHLMRFWLRPRSGREAGGLIGATGCMRARAKRWRLPLRSAARVTRPLVQPRGPTSLTDNLESADQAEAAVIATPGAIEARQVTINGQSLQVAIRRGGGSGPPLLLFNGIGANWELAKPFLEALTSTTAIIFDVPGVGGSPR
ncbi:MAG: alpha/beta fold hydrolase, partial [Chloroflexi bacterium]